MVARRRYYISMVVAPSAPSPVLGGPFVPGPRCKLLRPAGLYPHHTSILQVKNPGLYPHRNRRAALREAGLYPHTDVCSCRICRGPVERRASNSTSISFNYVSALYGCLRVRNEFVHCRHLSPCLGTSRDFEPYAIAATACVTLLYDSLHESWL